MRRFINNILFFYSSRFTDSKKYETDFIQCFQLDSPRRGEICNACVLLVKRFKRLPPGSNRHWGHVVDARTGPGLKSMTKFKKRKEEQEGKDLNYVSKIFKKNKKKTFKKETSSLGGSSDDSPPSPTESQASDDYDDGLFEKKFFSYSTRAQQVKRKEAAKLVKRRRKNPHPAKLCWPANHFNLFSDVVSDDQWRQRTTCCGLIYECEELEAVIINAASFKPCLRHQQQSQTTIVSSALLPPKMTNAPTTMTMTPEPTSTAIKKHQLFLKRNAEPSIVGKSCDMISSSNIEFSSNKEKTELMEKDNMRKGKKKFDCNFCVCSFNKKLIFLGHGKMDDILNENSYETSKLLLELTQEKIIKPQIINPLTSVNGDKMSLLKFKLANMARFVGNDNSSDSGYEEVQDGNKLLSSIAQMPPPADVLQSL